MSTTRRHPWWHPVVGVLIVALAVAAVWANESGLLSDDGHDEVVLMVASAVAIGATWFFGFFDPAP